MEYYQCIWATGSIERRRDSFTLSALL